MEVPNIKILDEKNNELDRQALSAASDIRYELRGMMKIRIV